MWGHCDSDLLIDELRRLETASRLWLFHRWGVHVVDERYTAPQGEGSDIESAALDAVGGQREMVVELARDQTLADVREGQQSCGVVAYPHSGCGFRRERRRWPFEH
jgi:hypothetical protein